MKYLLNCALIMSCVLLAGPLVAQENGDAGRVESERRLAEEARRQADAAARDAESARADAETERRIVEREVVTIDEEMREAEARLEEAARRIAELSTRRLPRLGSGHAWEFAFGSRPMLGISIDNEAGDGPVEGVVVRSVTPGGAAFDAGLRAGDVLTSINDESLAAENSDKANHRLLEFMEGVEEGDSLEIEYLRDGRVGSVELSPRVSEARRFAFAMPGPAPVAPLAPLAPAPGNHFFWRGGGWADMEMVPLTAGLGRYFGTDKGLLVVRAPGDEAFQLQDGDVIRSIGGREPDSVSHAVRILGSYQPGEKLEIEIMRDKRRRTLEIEMPDNRQSRSPAAVPLAPSPDVIVRRQGERR